MTYTIRTTARTRHIDGLGGCSSLTRVDPRRMTEGQLFEDIGKALRAARLVTAIGFERRTQLCKQCEAAALRALAEAAEAHRAAMDAHEADQSASAADEAPADPNFTRADYPDGGWSEVRTGLRIQKHTSDTVHLGRHKRGYVAISGYREDVVMAECGSGGSQMGVSGRHLRTSPFVVVADTAEVTCRKCAKLVPCEQFHNGARCARTGDHKVHMAGGRTWEDAPVTSTSRVEGLRLQATARGVVHDGFRSQSGTWTTCGTGGAAGWTEASADGGEAADVTCKRCVLKLAEAEANRVHALAVEVRRRAAQVRIAADVLERVNEDAHPERYEAARARLEDAQEAYRQACDSAGQCIEMDCDGPALDGDAMCTAHVIVYGRGPEAGVSLSSPPVPIQDAAMRAVHHGYHNGLGALRALCEANDAAPPKSYWRKLDAGAAVTCSRCAALVH